MNIFKNIVIVIFINSICLDATGSSADNKTRNLSENNIFNCFPQIISFSAISINSGSCCDYLIKAVVKGGSNLNSKVIILYGDGSPNDTVAFSVPHQTQSMTQNWTHQYCTNGVFTATLNFAPTCFGITLSATTAINVPCTAPIECYDCISSFAPIPGKKYLVSGWAKENNPAQSKTSYTYPSIQIFYPSVGGGAGPFSPAGNIIDGWQRIEGEFTIPSNATNLKIQLNCTTNDCFFDDVRVLPFDGSLKSYVYDPVTLKLVAELDERNYATLYEYDEDGQLIRVKKETEKGKMTIKENRSNTKK